MGWTKALSESALPAGTRQVVELEGHKVLLLNNDGKIYAVANSCPHMKLPMKKGKVTEDGLIVCPFHRSAFDLATGQPKEWTPFPPVVGNLLGKIKGETPLPVFSTRVENGDIMVDVV